MVGSTVVVAAVVVVVAAVVDMEAFSWLLSITLSFVVGVVVYCVEDQTESIRSTFSL